MIECSNSTDVEWWTRNWVIYLNIIVRESSSQGEVHKIITGASGQKRHRSPQLFRVPTKALWTYSKCHDAAYLTVYEQPVKRNDLNGSHVPLALSICAGLFTVRHRERTGRWWRRWSLWFILVQAPILINGRWYGSYYLEIIDWLECGFGLSFCELIHVPNSETWYDL